MDVPDNGHKDSSDIKRSLTLIENENAHTKVVAIAVCIDPDCPPEQWNHTLSVPAQQGIPICNDQLVYDTVRDLCLVSGVDSQNLGEIPISYCLVDSDFRWRVDVPLPPKVIKRYLTEKQKKLLTKFGSKYKKHVIQFLQLRSVY